MFKIGDYLVYGREVCKVIDIKKKHYNNTDYYVLSQVNDDSLKRELPIDNKKIRALISKDEIFKIIDGVSKIAKMDFTKENHKIIETEYKKLLDSGKDEDLIKVIKSCYLRLKERLDNNQMKSSVDETYLKIAETNFYTEISIVLNISYDEANKLIIDKL